MFKKFTDTLSGTLDTVKSYGSSMGIGQAGQGQDGTTAAGGGGGQSRMTLNLPIMGNGTVSAPVTRATTPDPSHKPSLASNTFLGIQNTIGKITGRGESTNAVVAASTANQRARRGPALGMAVETNETRITELHTLDEEHRVSGYHDITNYAQYKKVSDTGQMKQLEDAIDPYLPSTKPDAAGMNVPVDVMLKLLTGTPKLVRSNTDEIIDQEFATARVNLDDVLDMAEYVDELAPVDPKKDEGGEEKKPKKKKNKHIRRCINCIQDNRVKGGCVKPEEMGDATGENLVLKKVLNIIFLVIGSCLFAAVFVVIIYTSVVPRPMTGEELEVTTPSMNETFVYEDYEVPELSPYEEYLMGLDVKERNHILSVRNRIDRMSGANLDWQYD